VDRNGRSCRTKLLAVILPVLLAVLLSASSVEADEVFPQPAGSDDDIRPSVVSKSAATADRRFWDGRVELKRENTGCGTPDETTKTIFKVEMYPPGVLSLVRLEVPFPDEKTDLEGRPFHPRLGDIKFRVGLGPFPWRSRRRGAARARDRKVRPGGRPARSGESLGLSHPPTGKYLTRPLTSSRGRPASTSALIKRNARLHTGRTA
jgi:hypothetical protein